MPGKPFPRVSLPNRPFRSVWRVSPGSTVSECLSRVHHRGWVLSDGPSPMDHPPRSGLSPTREDAMPGKPFPRVSLPNRPFRSVFSAGVSLPDPPSQSVSQLGAPSSSTFRSLPHEGGCHAGETIPESVSPESSIPDCLPCRRVSPGSTVSECLSRVHHRGRILSDGPSPMDHPPRSDSLSPTRENAMPGRPFPRMS